MNGNDTGKAPAKEEKPVSATTVKPGKTTVWISFFSIAFTGFVMFLALIFILRLLSSPGPVSLGISSAGIKAAFIAMAVILALPALIFIAGTYLQISSSITLDSEGISYQNPLKRWRSPWEDVFMFSLSKSAFSVKTRQGKATISRPDPCAGLDGFKELLRPGAVVEEAQVRKAYFRKILYNILASLLILLLTLFVFNEILRRFMP